MEKEDLKQKAEEFLNSKDLPQKIESFPSLIAQKVSLIIKLEEEVKKAQTAAKNAQTAAKKAKDNAESLKGFEEKSALWGKFKWKSGNTKEILENTQIVTKDLAKATEQNAEALDLAMKFEKELASTAEFLFYLGCYNIATNEAMIADLNEQLSKDNVEIGEKKIKLSAKVKEQFVNVVKRLQAQQDVLYRQEKLSKKSKKHGAAIAKNINQINAHESQINAHESRLKEKDRIDQEQTALINEIKKSLNQMDEELSDRIKKLIQTLEDKNALDKEQTSQIEEVRENFKLVYSQYGKLKKNVTIGFIVSYLSLLCIIGWLLFYS